MAVIKNVVQIGATGNLGPAILKALVASNKFNVTVLTRSNSSSKPNIPEGVKVLKTDYTYASLKDIFSGQDAVVSTIATPVIDLQKNIIDAAVDAGVKRFIPSEFGCNTSRPMLPELEQMLAGKKEIQKYLSGKASKNPSFTWTALATGPFFDWCLKFGLLGFSVANQSVTIYDSGNQLFSTTPLPTIGLAVTRILERADTTANQYLAIKAFTISQKEILATVEEVTGKKWKVDNGRTADLYKDAQERFAKGDFSSFIAFLQVFMFQDTKRLGEIKDSDSANELLGLSGEDFKAAVKTALN